MKTFFTSLVPQSVDPSVLTMKHVRILTHLSTLMLTLTSYDMENYQMYVNVTNQIWDKIAKSNNSAQLIRELEDENIIETNNKYSVGSFSKSYRYTMQHWNALKDKDYNRELLMPFKPKVIEYQPFKDKQFDDTILQKCYNNYKYVSMEQNWYDNLKYCKDGATLVDYEKYQRCLPYVYQIMQGNVTTMMRNDARLYHPLICMKKDIRKSIKVNGAVPKFIDVKACHAALLLYFCEDAEWRNIVEKGDVYTAINPDQSKYSRNEIKEYFQQAISYYKDSKMQSIARQIREKLKQFKIWNALEILFKRCEQENTSVQMILQQLESSIFVEYMNESDEWMLPMHDGMLVEQNFNLDRLQNFARAKLGFELVMCIV